MVRPTPYPFRDHSTGMGFSSGGSGLPTTNSDLRPAKSHNYREPAPAFNISSHPIHRESDVDPASSFAPQTQISSATSPSLSVPTKRPSRSLGSVPTTSPSLSGVAVLPAADLEERPHARKIASEGTSSPPSSQYHAAHPTPTPTPTPLPRGSGPSAGRPPPLSEKAQIHLHPDRGLTVVPHGAKAKAPRSGPPAARDAAWGGQGQGGVSGLDDRPPEGQVRSNPRGTGGSDAAPRLLEAGDGLDACGSGTERQAAATGMAREKRRRQEEHGGEEWEGEAPPAYCE
ncbi:hypothetical protein GSI_14261 [Ganoderma sinense ZZ0214-1]|uniref:Uncharacterized protein n=1 Tax=Ganoderma sinense ZZ0214-1 TaxID=1077348 RepID=A0A2G8RSL1_9APHY|nr:hypothetical protein GSI_14261 [Ganoderma sinense ZZ0214-1]